MEQFKLWWKSKTLWVNGNLVIIGAIIEVIMSYSDDIRLILTPYLGVYTGLILMVIGIVGTILRLMTTKAIK